MFLAVRKDIKKCNTTLEISELHVQASMTPKIVYLNLSVQRRDDLTENFTEGDGHLGRGYNIFKGMRKRESTTYILGSKSRLVLLHHGNGGLM